MDAEPLLIVRSLHKAYALSGKKALVAVEDLSLSVRGGECFGLLGPNGAGKSTTINCLTGFFPPTRGDVKIFGHDVFHAPKLARQQLGVCPQEDTLDTDFTLTDQLIRHAAFFRIPAKEARRRAEELLEQFQLKDKSSGFVDDLSGGMRRKLQVARALISNPRVLVLDEPTTGLDPEARRSLWEILTNYRIKGMAILLTTHYLEEAERLCDRVAMLFQGKIVDEGPPQDLVAKHVGADLIEEELRPGVVWKRPPNLEDVFLRLTGQGLSEQRR